MEKIKAVLMLGQSNMAGRGELLYCTPVDSTDIFMFRNDNWQQMSEPIHDDKPTIAGACLGATFARGFADEFGCKVGLIPAAFGGTSLADWQIGGQYYMRALNMAKAAMADSDIACVLWHQGEADQGNENYCHQLREILDALFAELSIDKAQVPLIAGELGYFRPSSCELVHRGLRELAEYYPLYEVVSAEGLTAQDVTTHFDGASLRVFGYRYFDAYLRLVCGRSFCYNTDLDSYRATPDINTESIMNDDGSIFVGFDDLKEGFRLVTTTTLGNLRYNADSDCSATVICRWGREREKTLCIVCGRQNASPSFDVLLDGDVGTEVTVEADFMLGEGHGSGDVLKLVGAGKPVVSIPLVWLDSEGRLCNILGFEPGEQLGYSLSEFEWSNVKVVCHPSSGTKDIILNGISVLEGAPLAPFDTSDLKPSFVRVMHFKQSERSSVLIDNIKIKLENK